MKDIIKQICGPLKPERIGLPFLKRFVFPVFLFISFAIPELVLGQNDHQWNDSDWVVNYNQCNGKLTINLKTQYQTSSGLSWFKWMTLAYRDQNGNHQEFFNMYNHGVGTLNSSCTLPAPPATATYKKTGQQWVNYNSYHLNAGVPQVHYTQRRQDQMGNVSITYAESLCNSTNQRKVMTIVLDNMPDGYIGQDGAIRIQFDWGSSFTGGGRTTSSSPITNQTFSQPGSGAVSALSATTDTECGGVNLSWQNGAVTGCTDPFYTEIFRKIPGGSFAHLSSQSFPVSAYSDVSAVKGVDYDYKVRNVFFTSNRYKVSNSESFASGRRLGALPPPTDFIASNDDCGDRTLLKWNWPYSTSNLAGFWIGRRIEDTGNWTPLETNLSTTAREYEDNTANYNQEYEYRIYSNNVCTPPDYSEAVIDVGLRPGPPIEPTITSVDVLAGGFRINWTVPSNDVNTGYIIERSTPGGGTLSPIVDIHPDSTSYTDTDVLQCVSITYKVKASSFCFPDGQGNSQLTGLLSPDLSTSFPEDGTGFGASKGYFSDKVELNWLNANEGLTNTTKVYRRILGSGDALSLLTTLNGGSGIYNDLSAAAGELYEYEIVAEGPCENFVVQSNTVRTIGFRRKTGIVTGQITYEGGAAVENVKVITTGSNPVSPSLQFAGIDTATVVHNNNLNPTDQLIIESWIKPDNYNQDFIIVKKDGAYELAYNMTTSSYDFSVTTSSGTETISLTQDSITLGNWQHIAGQLDQNSLSININGQVQKTIAISSTASIVSTTSDVLIGPGLHGNLKEIRIWNTAKDSVRLSQDFSRFLAGNESGLQLYLNTGEGRGDYAYDLSRANTFYNKNHALLSSSSMWDLLSSPTANQLSISAFTDTIGNYNMAVPYGGSGENFQIKPIFNIHMFEPSNTSVFIGDGNPIENGVDFLDISAFKVTGQVYFDYTNCPSKDVFVKIDGEVVINEGEPVRTKTDGSFEIDVPIGRHVITLEKNGHEFSAGTFPSVGKRYFQAPVSGIEFSDATLRRVVGRVVGGTREGDKLPGLGRSTNNIGIADMTFDPEATCGWIIDEENGIIASDTLIRTDSLTGEYTISLPPLKYNVLDVKIKSNPGVLFSNLPLDLTNAQFLQEVADTVFQEGTTNIIRIDSTSYHKKFDYIHRSSPTIDVASSTGDGPLVGEEEHVFSHSKFGTDTISLIDAMPLYPVFIQNEFYVAKISTFEQYINNDNSTNIVEDRVPITDGILTINNELAAEEEVIIDLAQQENYYGDTLYNFSAGNPNIAVNQTTADHSFTRLFKVDLVVGAQSASWRPLSTYDKFFRGYVLGTRDIEQSDFVTQGPESVDYILRDPPGSQSYASLTEGTTVANAESWEWNVGGGFDVSKTIRGGVQFSTGLGFATETKSKASIGVGISYENNGGTGTSYETATIFTDNYTTSADPLLAGHMSDLFIGSSRNYLFGGVTSLTIVPTSICDSTTSVECFSDLADGVSIAIEKSLAIAPGDVQTTFVYTRNKIESDEIPDLQALRNEFLSNNSKYGLKISPDHACFGLNNDDIRFNDDSICPGTDSAIMGEFPLMTDLVDGPSYIFRRDNAADIDSVRIFNQQIRLWEEALAYDEMQKANATDGINYSYGGGGASLSRSTLNTREVTTSKNFEFQFTESPYLKIGVDIAGAGFEDEFRLSVTQSRSQSESRTNGTSSDIQWTVTDDSEWDDFSFDVFGGSNTEGPIFKLVAGRTSCPWEGPVMNKYYEPGREIVLSPGSIKLEQPEISISPSVLYNVPQDETAVFTMTLTNNNTVGEGWEYATKLLPETNPNSLDVNVGSSDDLTRTWVIPAQSSITRDIFVGIGNSYVYEDLVVAMHSTCQYQQGLSEEEDIVDEATFSVHFVPECTDIELTRPEDNWTLNSSYNNQLDIVAGGYNINHLNLDNITIEYKSTSDNNWIRLEQYHYDTTGMNDLEAIQIDRVSPFSAFRWNVDMLPDGPYDLRATSDCMVDITESSVYSGRMDRINPHAFGSPSPADGILDPDDDILIKFNEDIDIGTVSDFNIDVRGVLNGTPLRQSESLSFDGVDDSGEIAEYQLQKRSFTIETWVKRRTMGEQIILSQGQSSGDLLAVGFDASNNVFLQLGEFTISSSVSISDNDWHHIAVTYDRLATTASFLIDNTESGTNSSFETDYTGTGKINIANDESNSYPNFNGQLCELRLWSIARYVDEIGPKSGISLSGREAGLIGNWRMDEAIGLVAHDKVRSRHMIIGGATWAIAPESHAYVFDGSNYLKADNAGKLALSDEADITFEGWFKTSGTDAMTLLSNGIPAASDPYFWNINITGQGELEVLNRGNSIKASSGLNDDDWHHYAVVMERTRAISIYIDGQLVQTGNASIFDGYGGPALYVGAQGSIVSGAESIDYKYTGSLDDIRIWNVARKSEQIQRDMVNQLRGDEPGLMAYYPFDDFKESMGTIDLDETLMDVSVDSFDLDAIGGGAFTTSTPTIKLPRRIENVNFDFSINGDEIFIEPSGPANRIENVTLDITVKGIRDLAGNFMESPETWIAFVDQNQVFWEDEYVEIEKSIDDPATFTKVIRNTGGRQERFEITNLPSWLTASPISGLVDPNSSVSIDFTISNFVELGAYEQDIFVTTESFEFNERLLLSLLVEAEPPSWEVEDPAQYPVTMSYIGEIIIGGGISTDERDMVVAYINDTIRGVAYVQQNLQTGKHLVFLDIRGGVDTLNLADEGKEIVFKVWDASEDKIHPYVSPIGDTYEANALVGSLSIPTPFATTGEEELLYQLKRGWNWISFPIEGAALNDINVLLEDVDISSGDIITNHRESGIYISDDQGWLLNGGLKTSGLSVKDGYRFYIANPDTFSYRGLFKAPATMPISLVEGWNSIGVISENNIDVSTALSSLNPSDGDIIKGQIGFAVYEAAFGWSGTLLFLEPQKSYMLKVSDAEILTFPSIRTPKSKGFKSNGMQEKLFAQFELQPELHEATMSMVVTVDGFDGWDLANEWLITAYVGDDCRGVNMIRMDEARDIRLAYLSLYGQESEDIEFFLTSNDGKHKIPILEEHVLMSDGFVGVPSRPDILNVKVSPCSSEILVDASYEMLQDQMEIQAASTIKLSTAIDQPRLSLMAGEAIELMSGYEALVGREIQFFITPCK